MKTQATLETIGAALGGLLVLMLAIAAPTGGLAAPAALDDFEIFADWSAIASKGVTAEIAQDAGRDGMAMRLDFDFAGHSGFVIARKPFPRHLPPNFALSFKIRGAAPENQLEIKIVAPDDQNVWRAVYPRFSPPALWKSMSLKKRHFEYAWGTGERELEEMGWLEIAIASEQGGRGSIWIDQLEFTERPMADATEPLPLARASTQIPSHPAEAAIDGFDGSSWRSGSVSEDQWLLLDFQHLREYGGLTIDWDEADFATAYDVMQSNDGETWTRAVHVSSTNGGRDYVYMPESESRYLRLDLLKSSRGAGYGIRDIVVQPYHFASTPNRFFETVAGDTRAGFYPRYLDGRQSYWTVVGVAADAKEALINEDGMVEVEKGRFSLEPFLFLDNQLVTWNDVTRSQRLEAGYLPIPSVEWSADTVTLTTTALAAGAAGDSDLYLRYTVRNVSETDQRLNLYVAIRPFQVSPPWQSLNFRAGVSRIHEIDHREGVVIVDRDKAVRALTPADRFGASRFMDGGIIEHLRKGILPQAEAVTDDFGFASGAFEYRLTLEPGAARDIYMRVPFHRAGVPSGRALSDAEAARAWAMAFEATVAEWRMALNRVAIDLPADAARLVDILRSNLAYVLINADGPALQPGSRAYERSWIRDGSLASAALLRLGHPERVRDFLRWYSMHHFDSGQVPCCVDWRGADTVPENDSNGQWLFALAEYYRFTGDVGLISELWPQAVKALEYIDTMSKERMTEAYRSLDDGAYFGLVPASISHEGYSARPVHSYWDNFFTLLGLKDAVYLANAIGETETAAFAESLRRRFETHLYDSIDAAMARHEIDFIPGAADLGDFDFTATAIAVDPVGELADIPQPALHRTLALYLDHFDRRRRGDGHAPNYTPYELRIVAALVRMGRMDRVPELLDYFVQGLRPSGWNQWAEVVWLDRDRGAFIGDMPHTWVGTDFIRSFLSMLVFERADDRSLVIGAGILPAWLEEAGVTVKRMPTPYGTLNYTARRTSADAVTLVLGGDVAPPPGGFIVKSPLSRPIGGVTVDGRQAVPGGNGAVRLDGVPAVIEFQYAASEAKNTVTAD